MVTDHTSDSFFREVAAISWKAISRICPKMPTDDKEDIVASVMAKVHRSWSGERSALSTYVWRVTSNACIDWSRVSDRRNRREINMTEYGTPWKLEEYCKVPDYDDAVFTSMIIDMLDDDADKLAVRRFMEGHNVNEVFMDGELEARKSAWRRLRMRLGRLVVE